MTIARHAPRAAAMRALLLLVAHGWAPAAAPLGAAELAVRDLTVRDLTVRELAGRELAVRELAVRPVDAAGAPLAGAVAVATCGRRTIRGHARPAPAPGQEAAVGAPGPAAAGLVTLRGVGEGCDLWVTAPGRGFAWRGTEPAGGPVAAGGGRPDPAGEWAGTPRVVELPASGALELVLTDAVRGRPLVAPALAWRLRWRSTATGEWRPVPAAVVDLRRGGPPGVLGLSGLAAGWYAIEVAAEGYATPPLAPVELAVGERRRLRVALHPRAEVCGFVAVGGDGDLGDTFVRWWRADGRGRGAARVAADGSFCVGDLEGGVRVGVTAIRRGVESEPVYAPAPATGVVVELASGPVARGRVEVAGEAPVPGTVEIEVFPDLRPPGGVALPPLRRVGVEDPEGRFAVEVAPDLDYRLVLRGPGSAPAVVRVDGAEPPQDLLVELLAGTVVSGLVRSAATGEPVAGARVTAECWQGDLWAERRSAATASEGTFAFAPLAPGECTLRATRTGLAPVEETVRLAEADVEVEVDLLLEPEAILAGRVVAGEPAEPVPGAAVWVRSFERPPVESSARTDAAGRFRIGGLAARPHQVEVTHPREGRATVVLRPARGELVEEVVRLTSTVAVTGRVRGPYGPVAGARVLLHATGRQLRGRSGPDGAFHFDGVPAGPATVEASIDGGRSWCPSGVELRGPGPHHVEVDCGGGFTVRVVDPASTLRGGHLTLVREEGGLFLPAAGDGMTFEFRALRPGSYRLVESLPAGRRLLWRGRLDGPGELVVPPG